MKTNDDTQMNAAPDTRQVETDSDDHTLELETWQVPRLSDHGTLMERTGDQGLEFGYMAMS